MKYLFLGQRQQYHYAGRPSRITQVFARHDLLQLVIDSVHPANFRNHPPSPEEVAWKGIQIGLASHTTDFLTERDIWTDWWPDEQHDDPKVWS